MGVEQWNRNVITPTLMKLLAITHFDGHPSSTHPTNYQHPSREKRLPASAAAQHPSPHVLPSYR